MNAQPILHIGYHKTATTWFQNVFYPACTGAYLAPRRAIRQTFLCPTAFAFNARQARSLLPDDNTTRPIVCDEGLVGHYGNAGLLQSLSKDLAYRLHNTFPDGQVVIFLRNQLDMLKATYLQYIRRGGTRSVARFLWPYHYQPSYRTKAFKKAMFCLEHLEYHYLIEHYREVFGQDNVHIFLYEDFVANPETFLNDYAQRFQLDIDIQNLDFGLRNAAYGTTTSRLARLLNYITVGDMENSSTIIPVLPRKANEKLMRGINRTRLAGPNLTTSRLFGADITDALARYYAASNRVLEQLLNRPLADQGYPVAADDRLSAKTED